MSRFQQGSLFKMERKSRPDIWVFPLVRLFLWKANLQEADHWERRSDPE
jgi:hypothetical protein